MSRPSTFAKGVEQASIGSLDGKDVQRPKAIHVLSVDPVDFGCMVHDALLDEPDSRFSIAPDYRELWAIPKQESIHMVILHNTLSSFELEDASQFIRRCWPHARILVLRGSEGFLEDALYDDCVAPNVAPEILFLTIERLIGGLQEWRSGDVELQYGSCRPGR